MDTAATQPEHRSLSTHVPRTKSVLMIDYLFPPLGGAGVQRTLGYVRHLPAFGWTPVVLTVKSGDHSVYDASLLERVPEDVTVRRTRSLEPVRFIKALLPHGSRKPTMTGESNGWAGQSARRGWVRQTARRLQRLEPWLLFPDRRMGWLPFAVAEAVLIGRRQRVDVIYSTSTVMISHLVAYVLKALWRVPWVADFQDPWARNAGYSFASALHQRLADHLEWVIVKTADRVTVTTEPLREILQEQYPTVPSDKFAVIPMGFDPEVFTGLHRVNREKFTMTHFGNFYGPRSPGPFLTALSQSVHEDPDLAEHLEVWFLGNFEPRLRRLTDDIIRREGLSEIVRLEGTVPYRTGLQAVVSSDVLLLVTDPGGYGRYHIPSKLYEYLAAGRTILALAPEGAVARVMRATGGGVVVPPDDVPRIRDSIGSLYRRWREGRLDSEVKPESVQQFTWRALTAEFAATLERASAASGRDCATHA